MKRKDISNCWSGVIKDFDDLNNEIKKLKAENREFCKANETLRIQNDSFRAYEVKLKAEKEKLKERLSFYVSEGFECNKCGCLETAIEYGIELCDMCSETMDVFKQLEGEK